MVSGQSVCIGTVLSGCCDVYTTLSVLHAMAARLTFSTPDLEHEPSTSPSIRQRRLTQSWPATIAGNMATEYVLLAWAWALSALLH